MMYEKLVNRLRKAAGPAIDFPDTLYDEAADAIEELSNKGRLTGRWEHLNWGFDYDRCTVCGYEHRYNDAFNYCPNCGCQMEVEDDV